MKTIQLILFLFISTNIYSITPNSDTSNTHFDSIVENCKKKVFSNPDSALILAQKALLIARENQDSNQVAIAYNVIGLSEIFRENNEKGEEYCFIALSKIDSIKEPIIVSNIYNNLAKSYKDQQNYETALSYYMKSLNIREANNDTIKILASLNNIGGLYSTMEEVELSLNYFLKAISYNNTKDAKTIGAIYNNIAIAYKKLGKYELAIKYYKNAFQLFDQIGYFKAQAYILDNLGVLYDDLIEKNDSAIFYYNSALKIHEEIEDNYGIAITKINMALVLIQDKHYIKAKNLLLESEVIAKEINSSRLLEYAYDGFKYLYEQTNDFQKAYYYFQAYQHIVDSIYTIEKNMQIAELESKYQTAKKDKEIEVLQKNNEIKRLQLIEQEQQVTSQRVFLLILLISAISISLISWFLFQNFRKKQVIKQQKLEFQKITTEQKMLRSQMNPHFIYNSLNSIQSYISSDQSYEAEKYLARFAKLMRNILENSRLDFVTLDKEIETLDLYLQLEQFRFENRFNYDIRVDDKIETDFISIPPMLIQPFIENAILHGLKTKTDGLLLISFNEEQEHLICIVDDNGIGRIESENKKDKKGHASLATKITEERLKTLSNQLKKPAYFIIEDKTDSTTNKATGTKVTLKIPYIKD